MPSTYTVNLGIEKPATGEQSGTWGDTVNDNSNILDEAINGVVSITLAAAGSSGSPNQIAITNGASSTGRNKWIEFADGGDLGATAYVELIPNDAEKICFIRNSLAGSRSILLFQGTYNASNDLEIAAGTDVVVKFSGTGTGATVVNINANLKVDGIVATTADINGGTVDATVIGGSTAAAVTGTTVVANTSLNIAADGATVTGIKDEDNMASNSAVKLATQQSIKAYVDAQVATVDTLSEVLAIGNTSGSTDINMDTTQKVQFRDAAIYINSSVDGQLDIVADAEIQIAATTIDINGAINASGEIIAASLDISGNIDVDGITNLDVVDIDGAVQIDAAVTVGVDDTGHDVKFFGATGGKYMLWDQATDTLNVVGSVEFDSLSGTGAVAITDIKDEDNMASNSATMLATQQSIKAYVDAQVDTVDTLAEVLAIGNTSSGTNVELTTTDKVQFRDAAIYLNSSVDGKLDIVADTEIQIATALVDLNGNLDVSGTLAVTGTSQLGSLDLYDSGTDSVVSADSSHDLQLRARTGQVVDLYADDSLHATLSSTGLNVTGTVTATGTSVFASLDISGDIDVDGTSNLDIVDIDGAVDMASTLQVDGAATFDSGIRANGTLASPPIVRINNSGGTWTAGDETGRLQFYTTDPSGTGVRELTSIRAVTNTGGVTGDGTLEFWTAAYNTSAVKSLEIDGRTGALITTPAAGGHAVFNENGVDADFRVESDADTHALYVNGGTGTVNVGSAYGGASKFTVSQSANEIVCYLTKTAATVNNSDPSIIYLQTPNDSVIQDGYKMVTFADSDTVLGSISTAATSTNVAYNTSSDERLKENIVDARSQLDTLLAVKVREYDWKKNGFHSTGFIAQELHENFPEAVTVGLEDENKHPWSVDYGRLTPFIIKAMQEQQTLIEALTARITALEGA